MDESVASAVKSGLYITERNLNKIMQTFAGPYERSLLRSTKNDIHPAIKSHMLIIIDSMFSEIAFLKKTFNLRKEEDSASWRVHSLISETWTILEDCMPQKLTAYGKMTETDADILNRHIGVLLKMNDQLLEDLRAGLSANH